jgi:nitrite reductase/ring-hydroxylating ferredoxin subunit
MRDGAPKERTFSLADLPPCKGGVSRRGFCTAAGAGLIALGLPGCLAPGGDRVSTGGLDDMGEDGDGGGVGSGGGSSGGGGSKDGGAGGTKDGSTGGSHDMATGQHDMATSQHDMATGQTCATGLLDAGAKSSYSTGSAKLFSNGGDDVFVCRDAGGVYALSALCTHAGCVIQKQTSEFVCNCHGATFDPNGQHPTSPAFAPLDHYSVCVDGSGTVWVNTKVTVPATTRA